MLVHYGKPKKGADTLVAAITSSGGKAASVCTDLAAAGAAAELAAKVRSLVVLVANAGISKAGRIEDRTADDFDNLFATNARAVLSRAAASSRSRRRLQHNRHNLAGGACFARRSGAGGRAVIARLCSNQGSA